MQANAYDLTIIFGPRRQMFIPIYQRPYVWNKEKQWSKLWEDITNNARHILTTQSNPSAASKIRPHFMGAIVLDHYLTSFNKPEAKSVVDGQQRLTTLQIILVAIRDALPNCPDAERLRGRLGELVFNNHVEVEDDTCKVMPSNVDKQAYLAVMRAGSPSNLGGEAVRINIDCGNRIIGAYNYFYEAACNWINYNPASTDWITRAEAIINTITQQIRIVVIDIDNHDESQIIFETLNARGTALLEVDLVKNYLFRAASDEKHDINKLYADYWLPFEKEDRFWRTPISVGRQSRERIEVFLQHYISMQTKKTVQSEKLFDTYKEWDIGMTGDTYDWHLRQLAEYGGHYKSFVNSPVNTPEGDFFQRIDALETTTVYPFLLWVYEKTKSAAERTARYEIFRIIESYLIRRMICGLTTKNYNHIFLDIITALKDCQPEQLPSATGKYLTQSDAESSLFPNDEKFKDAWLNRELYRSIKRARLVMVLKAIESNIVNNKTEDIPIPSRLTVEHIMPQDWEDYWNLEKLPDESPEVFMERRNMRSHMIQTIGNLTLATQPLNSGMSNDPFGDKKKELLLHSKLKMNIELAEYPSWSEVEILKRAERLWGIASKIWAYPA